MKNTRGKAVRAVVVAAATVAVAAFAMPNAQAEPAASGYSPQVADAAATALAERAGVTRADAVQRLNTQPARVELGEGLVGSLGAKAAGMWLDQANDSVVVDVLDEEAAATVRAAGAVARVVTRGTAELEAVRDTLAGAKVTDTAVGIDVRANQVVVQIGERAGAGLPGLLAAADRFGGAVRVEHVRGTFTSTISGGYPILGASGGRCSLGFSTTGNTGVTAGHCAAGIPQWWDGSNGAYYGPSIAASFPGNDFGLIRNDGGLAQPGDVYLYNGGYQDITGAADPYYGLFVCKSGSTTGLTCGYVYAVGVTICYPEGCVGDLAQSDAYSAPGDSGGSWFSGSIAVGLTSGGGGGWAFFQPVVEALSAYGVWVY